MRGKTACHGTTFRSHGTPHQDAGTGPSDWAQRSGPAIGAAFEQRSTFLAHGMILETCIRLAMRVGRIMQFGSEQIAGGRARPDA